MWLCGCVRRPRGHVWMKPLGRHLRMSGCRVHPSLFRSVRWYACHACLRHSLAFYTSLHACLHVHVWVLLARVLSMLQHKKAMDIWSKPTFVSNGHHPCLFAILLCFLFCLHLGFYVCHVYHVYLLYAYVLCSLHLFLTWLVCWFLVFAFACTHTKQGRLELGHGLPRASKRGKDVSMPTWTEWQSQSVGLGFSFFPLVMYSFKTPPSSSLSPLDGLCKVYHALYHSSSSLEYGDPCLFSCTYIRLGNTLGM